jgi:hypothetical protein
MVWLDSLKFKYFRFAFMFNLKFVFTLSYIFMNGVRAGAQAQGVPRSKLL